MSETGDLPVARWPILLLLTMLPPPDLDRPCFRSRRCERMGRAVEAEAAEPYPDAPVAFVSECTGLLQVQAAEIKAKNVNWQNYLQ